MYANDDITTVEPKTLYIWQTVRNRRPYTECNTLLHY